MRGKCPACRAVIDLEDALFDQDLIAIGKLRATFGRDDYLVWAYVELFGVLPLVKRRKKVLKLLTDMKRLYDAGEFDYDRRRYGISAKGIAESLNTVVTRHFTDRLENHNYLKKIMIGISEREGRESGKAAERDLRKREDALQAGHDRSEPRGTCAGSPPQAEAVRVPGMKVKSMPPAHLTEEQIAENKRRLKAMISEIG